MHPLQHGSIQAVHGRVAIAADGPSTCPIDGSWIMTPNSNACFGRDCVIRCRGRCAISLLLAFSCFNALPRAALAICGAQDEPVQAPAKPPACSALEASATPPDAADRPTPQTQTPDQDQGAVQGDQTNANSAKSPE